MHIRNTLLSAALCTLCAGPSLAAAPRYGVTLIDPLPGNATVAALNNAGTVVGRRYDEALGGYVAYAWNAGQFTTLPGQMESPRAISNAGHIAGVSPVYEEGGYQQMMSWGMVYHQGVMHGVPDPITPDYSTGRWYTFTSPLGVNSAGTVLAMQETNAGSGIFLAHGDNATLLPMSQGEAINEAGQVLGNTFFDNGTSVRAVLYDNGNVVELGSLAADGSSVASDLNDSGLAVGTSGGRTFIWRDGVMEAFGGLANETATAVNNHEGVIGTFIHGGTGLDYRHSYLYQDGVQYDLQDLLAGGGGWRITDVTDINDSGQIAGRACNGAGQCFAALLVPVPEPATWGMLLAGLGVVAAACRRGGLRRRAA